MSSITSDAEAFLARLTGIHDRITKFQLNFAFGELVMALEEATSAGITLNAQHLSVVSAIRQFAADAWPWTTGLEYAEREWLSIAEHRDNRQFSIDGFVPRAASVLKLLPYSHESVFEVCKREPEMYEVLSTLFPNTGYADFASLSIDEVRARYTGMNEKPGEEPPAYPCWSCGKPVTEEARSDNDGFCPHCMAELDSESWPPHR